MKNDIKNEVLNLFKNQPVLASFATVTENKKPWVRYVTVFIDQETLEMRFATSTESRKVQHISKQPEVHLTCGINDPKQFPGSYLQIQGIAKLSTTVLERKLAWDQYPNNELETHFKGINDPKYGVIIVEPYCIELVKFDNNGYHRLVWDLRV